jgi:hypothetical protein
MKGQKVLSVASIVGLLLALAAGTAGQPISAQAAKLARPPANAPVAGTAAITPGISPDWWSTVQETIRTSEYYVTWQDQTYLADLPAAYQTPNRANNLRTYFRPDGPIVIPRTWTEETNVPPWRLEMALAAWGRAGALAAPSPATLEAVENRIEYRRDQVVEWYRNDENGLKQGFTLSSPPAGVGPLQLDLAIGGDLISQLAATGTTVEFQDGDGKPVLRYSGLSVIDAADRTLPAWLSLDGAALSLVVDDAGAAYPIEVDPILTGLPAVPDWSMTLVDGAQFGTSVATAGDVDNDGYSDVIIGAPEFDGGQVEEGAAAVFLGSANGLELTASWFKQSDQAGAHFGWSVATAGDVDGDGDTEVIVGAPDWDDGNVDEGAAWVYYGSEDGLSTVPGEYYQGSYDSAGCGVSVATAGDVNGDGYADIIIGASRRSDSLAQEDEGWALVYYGSESGLSNGFSWHAEGEQEGAFLGRAVATAGDVNGDGYADVIVGAMLYDDGDIDEGKAFAWYGSADGLNGGVDGTPANAAWSAQVNQELDRFGESVSTAGDVNGDGYADVIVGAPYYENGQSGEGVARLYLGSSTGLNPSYDRQLEGNQISAHLGQSVATAGDVNGDGYGDVIVGAPSYTNGESEEGRAFVWYGSADGIGATSDWYDEGDAVNAAYGWSVATAGDVNGDGYSDIIVGAPGDVLGGSANAYYGAADSLEETAGWTKRSNMENAHFGHSVASAGDVNADGYADVIVGAPYWDGGQADEGGAWVYMGSAAGLETAPDWYKRSNQAGAYFGWSVGKAGDVNGDGYDDVIVGSPGYDYGEDGEGLAGVYLGSSSGVNSAPVWYKDSDHVGAQFGYAVGTAGDVNGDGYGDVIVGSPGYDSPDAGEGVASVYEGSPDGPHIVPDWHAEGDQAGAQFGTSVGTAGDVNCDGYSDVIVGAPMWDHGQDNEGGAWVYFGSPLGLSDTYGWRQDGDQTGANYGAAVGTAGDVNGDGCSDIIVGAPVWDGGSESEGKAFVYHSSGASLYLTPAWTKESDQGGAHFGCSVGTAGDVNGDGYADIIVGAKMWNGDLTDEGGAWVYHGSATGLHVAPDWHAEGDQAYAQFGTSVATAGDVNGDGYADVVVGAPWYDLAYSAEGQASVFYGNGGKGSPLAMYHLTDQGHFLAHLGRLDTERFRLSLLIRSPFGRGEIMHEIEAKPLTLLFDGSDTFIPGGAWSKPMPGNGTSMISTQVRLGMAYHWRLRTLYNPATTPFMPASRWVTIPWNGWNETDLRTMGSRVNLPLVLRQYP